MLLLFRTLTNTPDNPNNTHNMKRSTYLFILLILAYFSTSNVHAQTVAVAIEGIDNGTQVGAGATNTVKDNLTAENSKLWGVSNTNDLAGLLYYTYSDLAGATIPATIQAGTYIFKGRIGNGNAFDFSGLNDLTSGTNTDGGAVAGFFTTLTGSGTGAGAAAQNAANDSKNNMYTEFNAATGVTYTQPTEADPADQAWTTWTFTWVVASGSPVIGTDPYFAVYNKTGGNGSAFWDDSTLDYYAPGSFPEITNFSADVTEIGPSDPVTLSWATAYAATLTLDPGGVDVSSQSNIVVNPTTTTTYTLTASDGVNAYSQSIEIIVGPRINSLTANVDTVFSNDPVTLSWDVDNVSSLTLDPGGIDVSGETSWVVNPSTTTTYTLTASDGVSNVMETIDITVIPEIVAFSADDTEVGTGDPVTLTWTVEDATSLILQPGDIDVTSEPFWIVNPTSDTTYTLNASDGVTTVQADVTVMVGPIAASFAADVTKVVSGGAVTISWTAENFTSLTLDPGNVDVSGQTSIVVNPTENTIYTLTATDGVNPDVTATVEVVIIPDYPVIPTGGRVISVNFHVGDDADAQAEHELTTGETAGYIPMDGSVWNNINVGAGAAHNDVGSIFSSTALIDDLGTPSVATLAPSVDSTWFVGYAANAAANAEELGLPGDDDNLFNSYLALNGPSGDGTPADAAVLNISGLGSDYTSGGYTLIIYSDSDRRSTSNNSRRSEFTLTPAGGSPITAIVEDDDPAPGINVFDNTYVVSDEIEDGADYANFTIITGLSAASFSLEITSADGGRGAISGFQIIGNTGLLADPLVLNIATNGANLEFEWNSLAGMSYNLRGNATLDSDPSTWPIVAGQNDIPATEPTNTLSIARPGDDNFFYIIEEFPTPVVE